jgi:sugar transferase (PEP-CTERM/EpsH1 system associated)
MMVEPLRILILAPHLPYPPHAGGTLRMFGMIKGLAHQGHSLALLSFAEADQPVAQTPLMKLCQPALTVPAPHRSLINRLSDLLAGRADYARRFWSESYRSALADLLAQEHFDVIHIPIEMAAYVSLIREQAQSAFLVHDSLNAEYDLQWRIALRDLTRPARWVGAFYSLLQAPRLRRMEADLCRGVDAILACSEADAHKLAALPHTTHITVIPNAISVDSYASTSAPIDLPHPLLVFTGKMDYRPNIDAAIWLVEDIFPQIRQRAPQAHLAIVGQKPTRRIQALAEHPNVTVTGAVDHIEPYLAAAEVYLAPLRMGSGTRFKLLEAMAMRRAVVSTRLGAEGLAVEHGRHLLLADTATEFAAAVYDLLADSDQRQRLGEAGRALVSSQYDWAAIIPSLEKVYAARRR